VVLNIKILRLFEWFILKPSVSISPYDPSDVVINSVNSGLVKYNTVTKIQKRFFWVEELFFIHKKNRGFFPNKLISK